MPELTLATSPQPSFLVPRKNWQVSWRVEKFYNKDAHEIAGVRPDEVIVEKGNLLLNDGINLLLRILTNTHGTLNTYSSGNSTIWVGNSSTAAAASQTNLQGASKASGAMDSGYPSVASQTASWKSTFASADGNFAWEEVGVSQGGNVIPNATSSRLLNRKVQSFGTKASGSTWSIQLDITIS